ncbi:hypothetical protein ISS05_04975 [Candidatus Woesearchaeota archaeon]|nr:hypothetical protein [Candidatus Woesearchaeota archaeon]
MATDILFKSWAEFFFFVLIITGIIIALSTPSAIISYFVIFLSGIFAGRLLYFRKKKLKVAYYIVIAGFLIGYLLGSYYGNRKIIIVLFFIGAVLSYYMFDKNVLKDLPF